MENNVVKSNSKAYGYNYASLSDIANQGFKLPKMKTGTENEKEYVYYYDEEIKEWIRGAEVVIPEMKGSNEAQKYGSALTYARRYTTLMALQLSCDDDKKLDKQETDKTEEKKVPMITQTQKKIILDNGTLIREELLQLKVSKQKDVDNLTLEQASQLCRLIGERMTNE